MGPEDLGNGVGEPLAPTSRAAPEVSRILVEEGWINRLCHVIADQKIPIRGSEIPAKPGGALTKRFIPVRQLAQATEHGA